jgi:fluoroquinolone transport system ATP-binding protein
MAMVPSRASALDPIADRLSPPVIDARDLTFTYAGSSRRAVQGMSFSVGRGEIFGFLGPSGAGKSTTQKILIGLLKGYGGAVEVFGKDLRSWEADYYERIGVSFELPNHYRKLTARENLEFFRSLYAGRTADPNHLLAMLGLAADADVPVARFSKGMQSRLTFARALLNCPELLFLDEPTAGLDPVNSRVIRDIIRQQQRSGTTIFMTTHAMDVADELCDRVAFVIDGQIALIDSPRALKLRHGERRVRVEYRGDAGSIHRDFPLDGLGDDEEFLTLLKTKPVETIHTREASLEDIFIAATGRSLA